MNRKEIDFGIHDTLLNDNAKEAVYDTTQEGEVIVMTGVGWNEESPFYKYPQPSLFTVIKRIEGQRIRYLLRDKDGAVLETEDWDSSYFYHLQDWLDYVLEEHNRQCTLYEDSIDRLVTQRDAFKEVLIKQGKQVAAAV